MAFMMQTNEVLYLSCRHEASHHPGDAQQSPEVGRQGQLREEQEQDE